MSPVYIISFTIFGCISFCIVWISKRSSLWGHVMLCSVNFAMTYDTMLCELCWEIWCDALWFMLICVQMNSFLYCQQQRSKYILLRTKFIMQWRKELNKIITAEKKINKTTQYHRYLQDPETRSSFLRDSSKQVPGHSPDRSLLGDISPTHVVLALLLDIAELGVEWHHIVQTFQRHLVTSHLLAQQCQHVNKSTTEHTLSKPQ